MLSLDEARERLLARVRMTDGEQIALADALGRVLVEPRITATLDVPPFANSSMDGFAVRAADTPGVLRLAGEVAAGAADMAPVEAGTTLRIMTGAPLPHGADAVVPLEEASESGQRVSVPAARQGAYVRAVGSDTVAGSEVCLVDELSPASIAVLASLGMGAVSVRRRPRVAVLSTGDELVEPGAALGPGQIHDANGLALAAAVADAGGVAVRLPRVGDDPAATRAALHAAVEGCDLVVTSGGVSVGRHDHLRDALEREGQLDFWRIAVQPGKPLAVGSLDGVMVIGLPGNPVSALVTFELFARPFVRSMLGLSGDGRLHLRARPEAPMPKDPDRRAFLRVVARREGSEVSARSAGGQGSAQLRPLAEGNALLIVPEGEAMAEPERHYETIVTGAMP